VERVVSGHPSLAPIYWLGEGYHLFRATKDYAHVTPSELFAVLHDWEARPSWDLTMHSLTLRATLHGGGSGSGSDATATRTDEFAQHITRPVLGGVVGAREFTYVVSARHERIGTPEEMHLSSCRWHAEAEAAVVGATPAKGCVRGHLFMGGVTLRRVPGGDGSATRVVLVTCAAPRGAIPRAAANMGGVRGAGLLADLDKHLQAMRDAAATEKA
jgi:hypothetical protein